MNDDGPTNASLVRAMSASIRSQGAGVFLGAVGCWARVFASCEPREGVDSRGPAASSTRQAWLIPRRKRSAEGQRKKEGSRGALPKTEREQARPLSPGSADRAGYVRGRLDLDVATAADRFVAGRERHHGAAHRCRSRSTGPFTNAAGLQRVSGVGKRFLQQIDTLVTYSGTFAFVNPATRCSSREVERSRGW